MLTIWREYGLITILLLVAISGYFWLSESEDDVLASAMAQVSEHLLNLVPEEAGKQQALRELEALSGRIDDRQIAPAQLERLTASVLNLQASGTRLDGDEVSMVVRMALDGAGSVFDAAADAGAGGVPLADNTVEAYPGSELPTPTDSKPGSRADLADVARRMERVMMVYNDVASLVPPDSARGSVPQVHFDTHGGLRALVDDRFKRRIESSPRFAEAGEERVIEWRPRLADEVQTRRARVLAETEALEVMVASVPDSLEGYRIIERALTSLLRLESEGLISHPDMDSLAQRLKRQLETQLAGDLGATLVEIRNRETGVRAGS